MNNDQLEKLRSAAGFVAALDQSGGSTPKALADYGIAKESYSSDAEMFDLVHAMRTRIITNSAFVGDKILAAILFEQTMDRDIEAVPTAQYLWEQKHVVPVLKVDKGLADEEHGVQVMKPIDGLGDLLARAGTYGIFGTKMRSVIHAADDGGVSAVLDQQFEYAHQIAAAGFVPIIEPEVSIDSSSKDAAEELLLDGLRTRLRGAAGVDTGDAEVDPADPHRSVLRAERRSARPACAGPFRRLLARRGVHTPGSQSHDGRQLLAGAHRRPQCTTDRGRVHRSAARVHCADLRRLRGQGRSNRSVVAGCGRGSSPVRM